MTRPDWLDRYHRRMAPLGGVSTGNLLELSTAGDVSFDRLWAGIDGASTRVWMEMYIFTPDAVGIETLAKLTAAARRGCEVALMTDAIGSPKLKDEHTAALRAAGGHVQCFSPLAPWRRRGPYSRRNHRKIVVVDQATAFTGGLNISVDYAGPEHGEAMFHDYLLTVTGPATADLAAIFHRSWREADGHPLTELPPAEPQSDGTEVQILTLDRHRGRRDLERALVAALESVERSGLVVSPYFVPTRRLTRALVGAARRGAKMRVITAGRSDAPAARWAAHHSAGKLLEAGVCIFELTGTTLHGKAVVLDDCFSAVGSYNMDRWGGWHNMEVSLTTEHAALAEMLTADAARLLGGAGSEELTLKKLAHRSPPGKLLDWLAFRLLSFR